MYEISFRQYLNEPYGVLEAATINGLRKKVVSYLQERDIEEFHDVEYISYVDIDGNHTDCTESQVDAFVEQVNEWLDV